MKLSWIIFISLTITAYAQDSRLRENQLAEDSLYLKVVELEYGQGKLDTVSKVEDKGSSTGYYLKTHGF